VHIDVMPMPRSDAGNSCALMIIDRTTGAARAVPMKTKTSAEILEVYERGLLHRVPWDLDIATMRIVFSGVDYGSYHSELKIPVLRIEIWGRQWSAARSEKSTFQCVRTWLL
jgi:hypothetical protein